MKGPCWEGRCVVGAHGCKVHLSTARWHCLCPSAGHRHWPPPICRRNPGPSAPLCPGLQPQVPLPWVTRWGSAQGGEGGQRGRWSADGPAPSLLGPPRVGTHPRRSLTPGGTAPCHQPRSLAPSWVAFLRLMVTFVCGDLSTLAAASARGSALWLLLGSCTAGGECGDSTAERQRGALDAGKCPRQAVRPVL